GPDAALPPLVDVGEVVQVAVAEGDADQDADKDDADGQGGPRRVALQGAQGQAPFRPGQRAQEPAEQAEQGRQQQGQGQQAAGQADGHDEQGQGRAALRRQPAVDHQAAQADGDGDQDQAEPARPGARAGLVADVAGGQLGQRRAAGRLADG